MLRVYGGRKDEELSEKDEDNMIESFLPVDDGEVIKRVKECWRVERRPTMSRLRLYTRRYSFY